MKKAKDFLDPVLNASVAGASENIFQEVINAVVVSKFYKKLSTLRPEGLDCDITSLSELESLKLFRLLRKI